MDYLIRALKSLISFAAVIFIVSDSGVSSEQCVNCDYFPNNIFLSAVN
jgi:hypothetical protein